MATLFGQTMQLGGAAATGFYDIDFFFNSNDLLEDNNVLQYLCCPSDPPEILPTEFGEEFESYQCPKRRKINFADDLHYSPSSLSSNVMFDFQSPEFLCPKTESNYQAVPMVNYQNGVESMKNEKVNVSAQSVAARRRRRKISEKTAELGKLIPGGNRMNTAEMFHAAYKYIKFLQAQVGMLQLMKDTQGKESEAEEDNLVVQKALDSLLASPSMHEKLYSEEKCLVPHQFVTNHLVKDDGIRSNRFISKQIDLLIKRN